MFPFTSIETSRLLLRRFEPRDLQAFLGYRNDPDVARYQSWETLTPGDAVDFIRGQQHLEPGAPGSWFQFAVALKSTLELVGDCALRADADDPRLGELGFTFARGHQGRGLATEAVSAVVRFAFDRLSLHRLEAVVDCRNSPAIRLLERLGMRREAHFLEHTWFKGAWAGEYVYALLADEWAERPREEGAIQ